MKSKIEQEQKAHWEYVNSEEYKKEKKEKGITTLPLHDCKLKLLSEANGMTLLVSTWGQVFYVDKGFKNIQLVALNHGVNDRELARHQY